ncbi:MAG: hybrid sensor histidine kinase/response regulator, partial [Deltaproteobacteria bacterium]
ELLARVRVQLRMKQLYDELKEAQHKLLQADKLSAIGTLVSGVAHELNNPSAVILGYTQLLQTIEDIDLLKEKLLKINEAAQRCQRIIRNLLSFARVHKPEKSYVGINGILKRSVELLQHDLTLHKVAIRLNLDPNLPKTMADFHQIQQVFINILTNALQAISEMGRSDGEIRITTKYRGERLHIEFADNGPGISEELQHRIFNPFFTTKQATGTGLGLSISYGIIREHGGEISFASRPGKGTVFQIMLPVLPEEKEKVTAPGSDPATSSLSLSDHSRYRILIVDDEEDILDLFVTILKRKGFRFDVARTGRTALAKIEREPYDLIISDIRMPEMDGLELHQRLKAQGNKLADRIIFTTGDLVSPDTLKAVERSGNLCIDKPFDLQKVEEAILRCIAGFQSKDVDPAKGVS